MASGRVFAAVLASALALVVRSSAACEMPRAPSQALSAFVDGKVEGALADGAAPGVAIAVVRDGKLILSKGYGYADVQRRSPVDPDRTLFRLGSATKLFTYTAAMQLVEEGRLDLRADINSYLKDHPIRPAFGAPVTAEAIMAHRAGFEDGGYGYGFFGDVTKVPTLEAFVRDHQLTRVRAPGAVTAYSNFGVTTLGLAIQQISGEPYAAYIEQRVLEPLGMRRTTFLEPIPAGEAAPYGRMPSDLAAFVSTGYTRDAGGAFMVFPNEHIYPAAAPAGALFSTAGDMSCFMGAYLSGGEPLMRPQTFNLMKTRIYRDRVGVPDYAHGFLNGRIGAFETFEHSGALAGYRTNLVLVPEAGVGVFMAVNTGDSALTRSLPRAVIEQLLGPAAITPDITPPRGFTARAAPFLGRYLTERRSYDRQETFLEAGSGEIAVTSRDDYLLITREGESEPWVEIAPRTFREAKGAQTLFFEAGPNGRMTRFYLDARPYARIGPLGGGAALRLTIWISLAASSLFLLGAVVGAVRGRAISRDWTLWVVIAVALVGSATAVCAIVGRAQADALGVWLLYKWPLPSLTLLAWLLRALWMTSALAAISVCVAWSLGRGSLPRRLAASTLVCALLAMCALLTHWNAMSSPFN